MKKLTKEEFISRSNKMHNNFYKYSLVEYINQDTKINITCPEHGGFEQRPDHHLAGRGCLFCANSNKKNETTRKEHYSKFIKKATKKWNGKYDYSKVNYTTARGKVIIICPEHGDFEQVPDAHMKHECLKCSIKNHPNHQQRNTEEFIKIAKKIHGDKYDYSKVDYKGNRNKIEIICSEHGSWWQAPYNHIQNKGCRCCTNRSKGEIKVESILKENNINFVREKTFDDCRNPESGAKLKFDFYIPEQNLCIEYDGRQHFVPIEIWGGELALKGTQKRDKIKNEYCHNNNIRLIRISYKENVSKKLIPLFS